MQNAAEEDWSVVLSLLPAGWDRLAFSAGAVERLRGFQSTESLFRTLMLHVGNGHSLRETAVRARLAGLASVSDVTILHRLQQSELWLRRLCHELLAENGFSLPLPLHGRRVRLLDGTVVRELGRTGSAWRVHYSVQIPSLLCDQFEITPTGGTGTGESLARFASAKGDLILADAGYCKATGIAAVVQQGADLIVRVTSRSLRIREPDGQPFALLDRLRSLGEVGTVGDWDVQVPTEGGAVSGRICALRKTRTATSDAQRRIQRKAQRRGYQVRPETLEAAGYVVVFTTLPAGEFPAPEVMQWYRARWQIELVFKRLKSVAAIGYVPKREDGSARAWLYGKLLIALLTERLIQTGRAISPWGYLLPLRPAD